MEQYLNQVDQILRSGEWTNNRTGVDTIEIWGMCARYRLQEGFPAVTTKVLPFKSMLSELIWFLSGSSNINDLKIIYPKNKFWDANYQDYIKRTKNPDDGDMGSIYGYNWRYFVGDGVEIDQIAQLEKDLINNRDSRRLIVSAWHPCYLDSDEAALPPCHVMFQARVINEKLHLLMYQRSCDMFLGVPNNIASYATLTYMLAHTTGLQVGDFVHVMGSAHIYKNHQDQMYTMLTRKPYPLPTLSIKDRGQMKLTDFEMEDFKLENYQHHPQLRGEMAV